MRRAGGAASRAMLLHRRTFTGTAHGMRYRGSPGVLGVGFVVVRKSSAARAAHRELRSLLRLFRASEACERRARPPGSYDAILRHAPKGSRANPPGIIGPKKT